MGMRQIAGRLFYGAVRGPQLEGAGFEQSAMRVAPHGHAYRSVIPGIGDPVLLREILSVIFHFLAP
jgi:hypothetical protein